MQQCNNTEKYINPSKLGLTMKGTNKIKKAKTTDELIKIKSSTKKRLDSLKIIPRESYDSVINRLYYGVNSLDK